MMHFRVRMSRHQRLLVALLHVLFVMTSWIVFFSKHVSTIIPQEESMSTAASLDDVLSLPSSNRPQTPLSNSIFARNEADSSKPLAVFYNIFIPPVDDDDDAIQNAFRVVTEQIRQVGTSDAAAFQNKTLTVYYNTIGKPDTLTSTVMDALCSPYKLECKHMKHYDKGFEEVTLDRVYEYCQLHQHQQHRVIYIHSKGSYHNWKNGWNDRLRRHLTLAATNTLCVQPPLGTCSVCGLNFVPVFDTFFPGNMWNAHCSYIAKLLPPRLYNESIHRLVYGKVKELKQEEKLVGNLYGDKPLFYGTERFANEHWIGSHPQLVACDLSKSPNRAFWLTQNRSITDLDWSLSPRRAIGPWISNFPRSTKRILKNESLRLREYFLLAGQLIKWDHLYGEAPLPTSWVWDWFPDGATWKLAVQEHGVANAVEVMTRPFVPPSNRTNSSDF
jgi:hypothetical protein